jgi:hypothetical protein
MKSEYFTNLVLAREALNPLWDTFLSRGRCWPAKEKNSSDNPLSFSNIQLFEKNGQIIECVVISQGPEGKLRFYEFSEKRGTKLGTRIREILAKKGLPIENDSRQTVQEPLTKPAEKKRKPPKNGVDGTGVYGSYPVSWAVMSILIKRSDRPVPLEEIIRNPWLIKTCYGIRRYMAWDPPKEKEAEKMVKGAISQLKYKRGYQIETSRDERGRLCYLTAETSIF